MSDGKIRFRTMPLVSAIALMMLLVSAAPSAMAYSPSWDGLTPMIENKSQAVVIADNDNGTIFIIGGGQGIAGSQFASASDSVIAYDVETGASARVASMPQGVRGACGGLGEDGRIYVFSGFNSSNIDATQIYDIATDTWSTGTSIPSMVFKGDCVVVWPEFYVFGWTGPDPQVQVFSALNDSWYTGIPLPLARQGGAAVYSESESAIYFMGGKDGGDVVQSTVFRFDIESAAWTTVQSMPDQLIAFDAAIGADGLIYAVGGTDNDYPFALQVYSAGYYYCSNNDTWYQLPDMSYARKYLGIVSLSDGRILAVGGNDDTAILDAVESLSTVDATSSLSPASVGQGGVAMLALDFDSYASQTGADLTFFMKSESGAIYPEQSGHFPVSGLPSVVIYIAQSMPAGNYTLYVQWTLEFETGSVYLPEEAIEFDIFQTVPLPDQITALDSDLTAELNSQQNMISLLVQQTNQLAQEISDLQNQLNLTEDDLNYAMGMLGDKADDAINAANSASTFAIIAIVLVLVLIIIMIANIMMSKKK